MKKLAIILWILYPISLMVLCASLLTSNPYMRLSKGLYDSHAIITYDHDYVARQLIDYLNYRHNDLRFGANAEDDTVLMRDIEIRHMVDVRTVYTQLRLVAGFGFLLVIGLSLYFYKKHKDVLYYTYKNMHWPALAFLAFVGTWFLIDFNRIFTWFHLIFFDNDDWLLRSDDVLILLLPENFWLVSGILIILGTVLIMGLTYLANERYIKPLINKKHKK